MSVAGEVRAIEATLHLYFSFGLMLELYDFLGENDRSFLQFVERFGGLELKIPTAEELSSRARATHIYASMERDNQAERTVVVLANLYGITPERVRLIHKETALHAARRSAALEG